MLYRTLTERYERIEGLSSRLQVTAELANLFRRTPVSHLSHVVYLTQGKLYPDWEGTELGVAEKMAIRAVAAATHVPERDVMRRVQRLGDLGSAGQELARGREAARPALTIADVYAALDRCARIVGRARNLPSSRS